GASLTEQGCRETGSGARRTTEVRILSHHERVTQVVDLNRPPLQHRAPGERRPRDRPPLANPQQERLGAELSHFPLGVALSDAESRARSLTEPAGIPNDRVEDRLNISRRTRNHAQDLAGRRLLLKRLADLSMSYRERPVLLL